MTPAHSMQRRSSLRSVLVTLLPLLFLFGSSCVRNTAGKSQNGKPGGAQTKSRVKVAMVEHRQQQRSVEAVGTLFAFDEVTVSSEAEGRVEEVMVDVGDLVSKGQSLARVSPVEFQ